MKTCTICTAEFNGRASTCSLECRDTAAKARRHARHVASYIQKPRAKVLAGLCKVCGEPCSGLAKTCSAKCRKALSRKRRRIAEERQRLGLVGTL